MDKYHNPTEPMRPALGLQLICQTLDELGPGADAVCDRTGMSRHFLETPGQLISQSQEVQFIEAAIAISERSDLAFRVGMRYHFGVFGVWGLAQATSANLLQALDVAEEFIALTHSFAGLKLQRCGDLAVIEIEQDYPGEQVQAFVLERDLVVTLMIASEIAGRRLPVDAVDVSLPEPAHSALFNRMLDCEVNWGSAQTAARIRWAELEKPLPQANPITWSACVRQCRDLQSQQRGEAKLTVRVKECIARTQFRGITAVCEMLNTSERSLRRRLQAEGRSYRQLQQELRRELAELYLTDESLSLDDIAERLGYSESANFCHAFREWTGSTPGATRQRITRGS